MTDFEQHKEHIEYTFNAYCKVVILHAAIDEIRRLRSTWKREISFEYLTEEKFYPISTEDEYFAEPEQRREYPVTVCGQTVMLDNPQLAAALPRLPEQWRKCCICVSSSSTPIKKSADCTDETEPQSAHISEKPCGSFTQK